MAFPLFLQKIQIRVIMHIYGLTLLFIHLSLNVEAQDFRLFKSAYILNQSKDACPKNQKVEVAIQTDAFFERAIQQFKRQNQGGINPFDPNQISIEAIWISPSGKVYQNFGFYFEPFVADTYSNTWEPDTTSFPWRVRFAPNEVGTWKVKLHLQTPQLTEEFEELGFTCVESLNKGRLITKERDSYLSYKDENERFLGVGVNISSGGFITYQPNQQHRQLEGLQKLKSAGGNYTRLEMGGQAALPDWNNFHNYFSKMDEMAGFDEIVDYCTLNEIYFTLFRHHVEVRNNPMDKDEASWDKTSWYENPYRNGFQLKDKRDYFTNEEILLWQKHCLRYIFSRWAYSPKFTAYGYSEIDRWYEPVQKQQQWTEKEAILFMKTWLEKEKTYLKKIAPEVLTVHSYSSTPKEEYQMEGVLSLCDLIALHIYGETKDINFNHRFEAIQKAFAHFNRPVQIEEMGINDNKIKIYCATGTEFSNALWATFMSGSFGTGLDWWWDRGVFDFGYEQEMRLLEQFIAKSSGIKNNQIKYLPSKNGDSFFAAKRKLDNYLLYASDQSEVLGYAHFAPHYWRNEVYKNEDLKVLLEKSAYNHPCMVGDQHDLNQEGAGDYQNKRFLDNYSDQVISPLKSPKINLKNLKRKTKYRVKIYVKKNSELILIEEKSLETNGNGKLKLILPSLTEQNPDMYYMVQQVN